MNKENDLVLNNIALVRSIVKRFKPRNLNDRLEYEQAGLIGLMKAIRKHDPAKGQLSTIAFYHINGEIIKFIKREKQPGPSSLSYSDEPYYHHQEDIYETLPMLSETERTIIELRLQGHTFKEIGQKFGNYSKGWANNIYRNILKRIKHD
jgi:RNA polymerase sigma factor (sigma-70 family)